MKKKIVLWGTDENEKKILVALELLSAENKVKIYTFSEDLATEAFYNQMMEGWRSGTEVEFPEGHVTYDSPLTMSDDLLPENIKVQRTDLIARAKTEWHFVVLSSKLYDLYRTELEDLKERINRMVEYENTMWEEMKSFWSKVQQQSRERNLFRDHTEKLKDQTNKLFDHLKSLKSKANEELGKKSKESFDAYVKKLDEINEKVQKGLGLNPIFEELKKIQAEFKNEPLTRDDRSKLWNKIDHAFKTVKEKKYGKTSDSGSGGSMSRLQRRYEGLMSAIDKMEKSINRDKKDIDFQNKKVDETYGQLEMQIRQAKVKMVEERINSKAIKLAEMMATKTELDKRLEKEKVKEQKVAEKKEIEKAKALIKDKIASEIEDKSSAISKEEEKLKEAAAAINKEPKVKSKPKKDSMLGAIAATMGEALEDVVDTVKAVTEVVADQIDEKMDEIKESIDIDEKIEKVKETASAIADDLDLDDKIEKVKEVIVEVKEKIEEQIDMVVDEVMKPDETASEDKPDDKKPDEAASEDKSDDEKPDEAVNDDAKSEEE